MAMVNQRLSDLVLEAFGDVRIAERWLRTPSQMFDNHAPIDVLNTTDGQARILRQLN